MPSRARNRHTSETARWLSTLPEPLRTQALENYNPDWWNFKPDAGTLSDALYFAFFWERTDQGYEYWSTVQKRAKRGEYDAK